MSASSADRGVAASTSVPLPRQHHIRSPHWSHPAALPFPLRQSTIGSVDARREMGAPVFSLVQRSQNYREKTIQPNDCFLPKKKSSLLEGTSTHCPHFQRNEKKKKSTKPMEEKEKQRKEYGRSGPRPPSDCLPPISLFFFFHIRVIDRRRRRRVGQSAVAAGDCSPSSPRCAQHWNK